MTRRDHTPSRPVNDGRRGSRGHPLKPGRGALGGELISLRPAGQRLAEVAVQGLGERLV